MAHAVNVNFRLDEDVKRSMEQTCSELGLSMSAAFTIFAKKVSRENNIRYLENIVRDIKEGKANFAEHDLIEVD